VNAALPRLGRLLLAALLLAASAAAAEREAPAPAGDPSGRWSKQGSSLVLYDSSGTIVSEIPLSRSENPSSAGVAVSRTEGGASADGRFAWTFEKNTVWNASKTVRRREDRVLRYYGTSGMELWSLPGADAPPHGDPVALSSSGETVVVGVLKKDGSWTAAARTFVGTTVWETEAKGLLSLSLTPEGRYALIRWSELDTSATHSFVELATGNRKDIPSDEFILGAARFDDDGKVFSGSRLLHDFKKAAAPDQP
jgi:hypothetical protein